MMTTTDLGTIPPIGRDEARRLAATEYRRATEFLEALDDASWELPTDCPGWSVRDLAGHILGSMRSAASIRQNVRELAATRRRTKRLGGPMVDHMTAIQIEGTADLSRAELLDECRSLIDAAARGRHRTPALLRRLVHVDVEVPGLTERWSLGYLVDTILTRDTWMHRVDLSRATGRPMALDAEHDGRIVADVAREWAERHGQPARLRLTGPAGGDYVVGEHDADGETIEEDAVEFCRIVSRRAPGDGVLAQAVPF